MEIKENLLLLKKENEFNNKLINYFYNRLKLFLLLDYSSPRPFVIATSKKTIIDEYYGEHAPEVFAFYDQDTHTVVFDMNNYIITNHGYKDKEFFKSLPAGDYKYIIPLSDVYHELIHHIQFQHSNYNLDDIIEASADIYSYILTGQDNIIYNSECTALWYVGRKLLRLTPLEFYSFIAKIITNSNYPVKAFTSSKSFLKMLDKLYKNNMKSFLNNIKKDYASPEYEDQMKKDLLLLHNMIFYKY